jgi:hypothetical protein
MALTITKAYAGTVEAKHRQSLTLTPETREVISGNQRHQEATGDYLARGSYRTDDGEEVSVDGVKILAKDAAPLIAALDAALASKLKLAGV